MITLEQLVDSLLDNPPLFFDWINPAGAPGLAIKDIACLPDLPGIYVVATTNNATGLERLSQIVYVGVSTKSIKRRWLNHHKRDVFYLLEKVAQDFQTDVHKNCYLGVFCWVNPFTNAKFLQSLERVLIDKLEPPCNYLKVGKNRDSEIEDLLLER